MKLSGQDVEAPLRVLVTGGASGIGAAVIDRFAADGADTASLDLRSLSGRTDVVQVDADLGDSEQVADAVEEAVRRLGGLDVVVNCAGIGAVGSVTDGSDDDWHRVYDTNVVGIARVMRVARPHLARSPRSAVVNIASVAAFVGLSQRAVYSASKGAVLALTYAMAGDLLADGIRVNAVSPGTTDTPWVRRLLEAADDPELAHSQLRERQPHGRLVSAEEVAGAVVYLASPTSGSTTGTNLVVDGGLTSLRLPSTST